VLGKAAANPAPGSQKLPRPGILLLAHGGALERNEEVRHVADRIDLSIPTEVGMAEFCPSNRSFAQNCANGSAIPSDKTTYGYQSLFGNRIGVSGSFGHKQ
jgi:hypothetical protein